MKVSEPTAVYGNTIKVNPALYREAVDYAEKQNINLTLYVETALTNLLSQSKKSTKEKLFSLSELRGILHDDGTPYEEIKRQHAEEKYGKL